jgi:cation transporter-like permease
MATAVIYFGTILSVFYAATSTPSYNLEKIEEFARNPYFQQYFVITLFIQLVIILHGKRMGFGMIHYTGLAGSLGGDTIILAKISSELLRNAISKREFDDMKNPISYLAVIMTILTALTQLHVLNKGLAKFEALVVVPVYQTFLNASAITGGLIFFQEYRAMSRKDGTIYTCGLVITLVGVKMLVQQRRKSILPAHVE